MSNKKVFSVIQKFCSKSQAAHLKNNLWFIDCSQYWKLEIVNSEHIHSRLFGSRCVSLFKNKTLSDKFYQIISMRVPFFVASISILSIAKCYVVKISSTYFSLIIKSSNSKYLPASQFQLIFFLTLCLDNPHVNV